MVRLCLVRLIYSFIFLCTSIFLLRQFYTELKNKVYFIFYVVTLKSNQMKGE